jgi:pyruvate/2-oxoglutarate dehydrogenase complex dihydrolipoamide acyltransferase (E2) component
VAEFASEAAEQLANENDVAVDDVQGTGADGNVTVSDIRGFLDARQAVEDTAPPVSVFLKANLLFRTFELEDGRVLSRDAGLFVHPDEWKSSLSKLAFGGVQIAEKR